MKDDDDVVLYEVGCALPDVGRVLMLALGATVIAGAFGILAWRRLMNRSAANVA